MKVTIKDVAKAAGVSASTVSRALRDHERISPEVRRRVQQVAKAMNFHPNQMARSLVRRESHIVGIVFPGDMGQSLGHPFYPSVLQGLGQAASKRRYDLLLATGTEDITSAEAARKLVNSGYVSGLILLAAQDAPAEHLGVPTVVVGHPSNDTAWYVDNNNVEAGRQAAEYLITRGHRRILFMGYDSEFMVTSDRCKGYQEGLKKHGIALRPEWIVPSRFMHNTTDSDLLCEVFQQAGRPTAAVCMDDAQAIAMTSLLEDMGLRVPEDVSLISFNNTAMGQYHHPALTSFDVNALQLGVSAMNLMLDVIAGDVCEPASIEVPFYLAERSSVAECKPENGEDA